MSRFVHGVALALVLSACNGAHADGIDVYVRATMAEGKIPGLALGIARGPTQHVRTYGLANLEHLVEVKPDTVFQSASTGKQFTAAAVLLLVEDGKLGIDDALASHFRGAPDTWKKITVRHLLTHTSGLPDYTDEGGLVDLRRDFTEDELAALAMKLPLDFEPGTRWSYSNTGYVVLGILVHKVSGQFYGDLLRARIFTPLGMSTARIISESDIVPNRAAGYVLTDSGVRNQSWVSPSLNTTADGSLYLTARDYLRWFAGLRANKVLQPASLQAAWTPVRLADGGRYPYGFGWFIGEQRGFLSIEHGGSWQGFRAHVAYYPQADLTIAVLCNLDACKSSGIARTLAGFIDPSLALPDPRVAADDPQPNRTLALREVLQAWASGKAHPLMSARLREPDDSPGASALRQKAAGWLADTMAFRFLAEDRVAGRGIERNGEAVARIVHVALVLPGEPQGVRLYLSQRGEVLSIVPDDR